jgi:hypothetical protein
MIQGEQLNAAMYCIDVSHHPLFTRQLSQNVQDSDAISDSRKRPAQSQLASIIAMFHGDSHRE